MRRLLYHHLINIVIIIAMVILYWIFVRCQAYHLYYPPNLYITILTITYTYIPMAGGSAENKAICLSHVIEQCSNDMNLVMVPKPDLWEVCCTPTMLRVLLFLLSEYVELSPQEEKQVCSMQSNSSHSSKTKLWQDCKYEITFSVYNSMPALPTTRFVTLAKSLNLSDSIFSSAYLPQ